MGGAGRLFARIDRSGAGQIRGGIECGSGCRHGQRACRLRALEGEDVLQMPIRVVIGRGNPPLRVHWCQ